MCNISYHAGFLYYRGGQPPTQPPDWRTIPYQLPKSPHSTYLQLPFMRNLTALEQKTRDGPKFDCGSSVQGHASVGLSPDRSTTTKRTSFIVRNNGYDLQTGSFYGFLVAELCGFTTLMLHTSIKRLLPPITQSLG